MPDRPSRLPARPSLEQLRKQAKELLGDLRAGDAAAAERFRSVSARFADPDRVEGATLAGAQFVLAREYGFESWAMLVRHVEAAQPPALDQYQKLLDDIVSAYRSGDSAALQRIGEYYQRGFTWEQLRAAVNHRLRRTSDALLGGEFSRADAQLLIANQFGFETWQQFEVFATHAVRAPGSSKRTPAFFGGTWTRDGVIVHSSGAPHDELLASPPYDIDWTTNTLRLVRLLSKADHDAVVGVMKEKHITGLKTEGLMTDRLLERLSELDHLTHLEVPASKPLTDAGLKHLARLPRLQHLDLSGCRITDSGLEVLRQLRDLRTFRLYHHAGVSDAGVAHLADCHQLERVELMGTPVGDGAVKALVGKPHLRYFLAGSDVTDAGLAMFHEFPIFKTWQGGDQSISFLEFAAEPNYLWLNLKAPFTNKGLANLAGLDGLFALNLFGGTGPFDDSRSAVTAMGVSRLADLPNLGWLGCSARLGNDESMRHISAMPRLRMLSCQDAVAGDEGFSALSRSQSIEYIWGRRCYNLTGRGFAELAAMPALRGLSVSCKHVDDAALSALPRFPALREFMPMDVPDEGFRHVGRCEQLEALWCMYCRETTDAATEHIGGLSRLTTYYAGATKITDRSLGILGRMVSLERLTFYACFGITDAGLAAVAHLPRLRKVSLGSLPNVTFEGAAVFPAHVQVSRL